MPHQVSNQIYGTYARLYRHIEPLFRSRIARGINALDLSPGQRVLDIGIGTGISLDFYPPNVSVTGIDCSVAMLAQASRRISTGQTRRNLAPHLTELVLGSALDLPFPSYHFDAVVMTHVISTVSDPFRALSEALRVCRHFGRLVIINHFRSHWPVLSWLESALDPICSRLGWHSDLGLHELLTPFHVHNIHHNRPFLFDIVLLRKTGSRLDQISLNTLPLPHSQPA